MHRVLFALFVFLQLSISCFAQAHTDLSVAEFEKGLQKGSVQLLDVRTLEEYNSGHLAGSLLADWNQRKDFERRLAALDKSKPVYVYCLAGTRSAAAADWLRQNNFSEVYELQGGIQSWKKEGRQTKGRPAVKQISVESFRADLAKEKLTLVDIGAVWCPPCKQMEPVIDELSANDAYKIIKVDGGNQELLAKYLDAETFPTFIIYTSGKEVWRRSGVIAKEELVAALQKFSAQ